MLIKINCQINVLNVINFKLFNFKLELNLIIFWIIFMYLNFILENMGNKPTKFHSFYKKFIINKSIINPISSQHRKINSYDSGYEEDSVSKFLFFIYKN